MASLLFHLLGDGELLHALAVARWAGARQLGIMFTRKGS